MHYIRITHTSKIKLAYGGVDLTHYVASLDDLSWVEPTYTDGTRRLDKQGAVEIAMDGISIVGKMGKEPVQFYTFEGGKLALVHPRWPKTASTKTAVNGFLQSDSDSYAPNNLDNLPDA